MRDDLEIETVEEELDASKVYTFSDDIKIVNYKDNRIAVSSQGISWIVLYSDDEYQAFEALRSGQSIESALAMYPEDAVMNVIMQIEAKKFDQLKEYKTEDDKLVYIYLTNNCNQRCKHCYMYAGDIVIEESSVSRWISVLDKLKDNGYVGVTFTGGEVTVFQGFEEVIRHAHEIGLTVTVLSNGQLWSDDKISQLKDCIDEIQISIDGYDDSSYYSVRQSHGFDKAIDSVRRFLDAGTRVSIAVTPLFEELDVFIERFEPFAKQLLIEYPNLFIKVNHELISGRTVKPTKEENAIYKRKLKGLVERLYPNYYIEGFVENFQNSQLRKNCGFGGLSIGPNGDVFWCNRIHELKSEYNVFKDDFSDIIRISKKIKETTSVDNVYPCKECEIRYICGGGCRLKFKDILKAGHSEDVWQGYCDGKESIYEKMIMSNEYFFEDI